MKSGNLLVKRQGANSCGDSREMRGEKQMVFPGISTIPGFIFPINTERILKK